MTGRSKIRSDIAADPDAPMDAHDAPAAMAILAAAIGRAQDCDLRHDQATLDAVACLAGVPGIEARARAFRTAIDVPHPVTRRRAMADAYRALCRAAEAHGCDP